MFPRPYDRVRKHASVPTCAGEFARRLAVSPRIQAPASPTMLSLPFGSNGKQCLPVLSCEPDPSNGAVILRCMKVDRPVIGVACSHASPSSFSRASGLSRRRNCIAAQTETQENRASAAKRETSTRQGQALAEPNRSDLRRCLRKEQLAAGLPAARMFPGVVPESPIEHLAPIEDDVIGQQLKA